MRETFAQALIIKNYKRSAYNRYLSVVRITPNKHLVVIVKTICVDEVDDLTAYLQNLTDYQLFHQDVLCCGVHQILYRRMW